METYKTKYSFESAVLEIVKAYDNNRIKLGFDVVKILKVNFDSSALFTLARIGDKARQALMKQCPWLDQGNKGSER
jgi:hypothetical protein